MANIFSHSRFALKYGLESAGFDGGHSILVPDYNCDVIYHPLRDLGLNLQFYPINDDFTPQWDEVEKMRDPSTKAIMMVHYFGQPQPIDLFKTFAQKNQIKLIEDNAHGHGGFIDGRLMGTFGDIGFSSPRKQLNLIYGGILYMNGQQVPSPLATSGYMHGSSFKNLIFKSLTSLYELKYAVRKYVIRESSFDDPALFVESELSEQMPDKYSESQIDHADWQEIASKRRSSWIGWSEFARQRGFDLVWDEPSPGSCPWIMPAYINDKDRRINILKCSWSAGLGLLPWPSLPDVILRTKGSATHRWSNLICFPLNKHPRDCNREINHFDDLINLKTN